MMSFAEGLDDMVGNYVMTLLDIIGEKYGEAIKNHTLSQTLLILSQIFLH